MALSDVVAVARQQRALEQYKYQTSHPALDLILLSTILITRTLKHYKTPDFAPSPLPDSSLNHPHHSRSAFVISPEPQKTVQSKRSHSFPCSKRDILAKVRQDDTSAFPCALTHRPLRWPPSIPTVAPAHPSTTASTGLNRA